MNKRIDFSFTGGFPATQFTLDWMQSSYRNALGAVAEMIGDKVIVSGMDEVGGNVTDGWFTYSGELIPFTGGALVGGAKIVITTTPTSRLFQDNVTHDVYYEKTAAFGGPSGFLYTDLKRRTNLYSTPGEIKMWSGLIAKIPSGWNLADGTSLLVADYPDLFTNIGNAFGGDGVTTFSLPNLKGKFIAGYDAADADYDNIGDAGGSKTRSLIAANNAPHTHTTEVSFEGTTSGTVAAFPAGTSTTGARGLVVNSQGAGTPFDIRPPFFTLAYIINLK